MASSKPIENKSSAAPAAASSSTDTKATTAGNATKLSVFVAGGTANTGVTTIQHLLKAYPNVSITAGVRNIDKAKKLFPSADKRLSFVQYDVKGESVTGDKAKDASVLKGFDALVIIPPAAFDNRVGLPIAYLNAAKAAGGIKHVVLISAPAASKPAEVSMGKDFALMEDAARTSGIPYTILQAVFFFDNQMMNAASIKGGGAFYTPTKGTAPIPLIGVNDIGEATANVVAQGPAGPAAHANKTYVIAGDVRSWDSVAAVYTKLLGKPVQFVAATDEQAMQGMTKMGFPESLAKGFVELNRDFERTGASYSNAELTKLLGHAPESFEQWLLPRVAAFKS